MSLAGFTHIGTYTLPTMAGVHSTAGHSFPVLLRYADFHPDVIAALKSDAGDLRFSLSDDTQIAAHVVRWFPATSDILVMISIPSSASATTGTEIKLWGNNSSATMLDPTDPFGQYAAYDGFARYTHDGTTNVANSGAFSTIESTLDSSGFSGDATNFDGVNDRTTSFTDGNFDRPTAVVGLWRMDSLPSSGTANLASFVRATNNSRLHGIGVNSVGKVVIRKGYGGATDEGVGTTTINVGEWNFIGGRVNGWTAGGLREVYLNGSVTPEASSTVSVDQSHANYDIYSIGSNYNQEHADVTAAHVGFISEAWRQPWWFADHGSNLTAVGAWGTMTSEVASSGDTNTANVSLTIAAPTFSGTGQNTVPVNTGDVSFVIGQPSFAVTGGAPQPVNNGDVSLAIAAPSFAGTAQNTLPEYTATILFNIGSVSFSGTGSTTVPINTGTVGLAVGEPTFAATGESLVPVNTGTVSFSIGEPQFSITGDLNNGDNNADVSFSLAEPGFSGTGQNTVPEYTGDVVFGIGAPTFSATGTAKLEGNYGDINFSISEPAFSGTGDNTVPVYSGSVSVTIQAPVFSATGTAVTPTNTGTIALTIPSVTFNGTGESTVPINQGTVQFSVPFLSFNLTGLTYDQSQLQFDTNTIRGTLPETILLTGSPNDPFSISSQIPSTLTIRGI